MVLEWAHDPDEMAIRATSSLKHQRKHRLEVDDATQVLPERDHGRRHNCFRVVTPDGRQWWGAPRAGGILGPSKQSRHAPRPCTCR